MSTTERVLFVLVLVTIVVCATLFLTVGRQDTECKYDPEFIEG